MSLECVLSWIEAHPGLASWLQAFFSVIAIVAAGWFPFRHERAKEKTVRRNTLTSLLYLHTQLRGLHSRLLETLQHEGHQAGWTYNDGGKEIELFSKLAAEIPASMLVGFEMTYLAELRSGWAHASDINKILSENDHAKIRSYYDYDHLLAGQKSQVNMNERIIIMLENELKNM